MSLNNWSDWALILSGFGTFFALMIAGFAWILKHTVNRILNEEIRPHLAQLQNNGGKSMKDIQDKIWLAVQTLTKTDGEHEARINALEK